MLNKVPQVTIIFWIIKILCTTTGETAADYLIENFLGLVNTTYVMTFLLALVLIFQIKARKYIPFLYWLTVVLLSIVGTLITDILTDKFHVSLVTSTIVFSLCLILTFACWYKSEKTLSITSINSVKKEFYYWLAILFTFALGTAAGDLSAESLHLGYLTSLVIFACIIAVVAALFYLIKTILPPNHKFQSTNSVLSFWIAYIFTRPLGATVGDYLSQNKEAGGLGFGSTITSILFLFTILALVIYLSITKKDQTKAE